VCASCRCIDHDLHEFTSVSVNDTSLHRLRVDPSLVPFDFKSGITTLDESYIMMDPNGVIDEASRFSLYLSLLPKESLSRSTTA